MSKHIPMLNNTLRGGGGGGGGGPQEIPPMKIF